LKEPGNRYFVRKAGETTDLARSPDDLLALDQPPEGDCYTIVADTPFQAVVTCAIMNQTMHPNPKRARTVTSAFKAGSRTCLRRSLRHIPVAVVPCRVQ